ncbi:MAG: helix-turn-helix domain-containing protein [Allomuricauda sp.]
MKKLFHFFQSESRYQQVQKSIESKYEKSGLTLEEAIGIKYKIKKAFEVDKLHKNNTIGLNELSYHIDEDRYKVSQVLNEYLKKSFYTILNYYRIQEAKDLLLDQPFLSVKAIMYEVGFNSKTSFYNAFKKETGLNPNDYRSMASYAS